MGNKRQRLAKKLHVTTSGGPTAEVKDTDGNKVSTNEGGQKSVVNENGGGNGNKKRSRVEDPVDGNAGGKKKKPASTSKHPLRVAGMKPGEGCFLCKSKDHIAKHCPTKSEKDRKKMCLGCRMWGHTLKNCPSEGKGLDSKLCYNCGEPGHSLDKCPKPLKDGGTAFAECFLCKERGHISKNCPSNKNGIYPKGGCCKICEGVTHLAKDCPQKNSGKFAGNARVKLKISTDAISAGMGGTRTVFKSGDDLEDDFQDMEVAATEDVQISDDENANVAASFIEDTDVASAPKTPNSKSGLVTPRVFSSSKPKAGHHAPKVVKF